MATDSPEVLTVRPERPAPNPPHEGQRTGTLVVRAPGSAEADPARFRRRRRALELILACALPTAVLVAWELASRAGRIDPRFWPAPTSIWSAGVELVRSGQLQEDAFASGRRTLIGFTVGSSAGVLCGMTLGMWRLARAALEPTLYALWTVPKLAIFPLLLLVFGHGETPIIVLVATANFFIVLIPTLAAVTSVEAGYREAARSFQANRWQLLRHVLFPASLPQIFVALRLAAGASVLVLIAAEFVQVQTGLGRLIWSSWSLFLADRMYVGIIVVSIGGAAFTLLVAAIGRRLTPWVEEN